MTEVKCSTCDLSNASSVVLKVIGMDNPHCTGIVGQTLDKLPGVLSKELLVTEKATIMFDPSKITIKQIKEAITDAGYTPIEQSSASADAEQKAREEEIMNLRSRFIISASFSVPLLFTMFGMFLRLPAVIENNMMLIQLLLTTPIMFAGGMFFTRGILVFIKTRVANMDTLVAVGVGTSYIYSLFATIFMWVGHPVFGHHVYYETSAFLITFILLGKWLEAVAKGRTSQAIKKLIGLQPKTATIEIDGKAKQVPVEDIIPSDIVIVKPGDRIPVDGIVISGASSVDESMITGESIPADKKPDDTVIGGTINGSGSFKFRATKVGGETMLAQIIKTVEEAQASKAPVQEFADLVAAYFTPSVVILAVTSAIFWLIMGQSATFALSIFITVLVISCPCALGLATPVAVMVGTGLGAERGILIKNAKALEMAGKIDTFVFDKTGTLTEGKPIITDILRAKDAVIGDSKQVLFNIAIAEKRSSHPIASAILAEEKAAELEIPEPEWFDYIAGKGVRAKYNGKSILAGNRMLMAENNIDISGVLTVVNDMEEQGKTVVILAVDGHCEGAVAVADTLKKNTASVISKLKRAGKRVIMITGDNEKVGRYIAKLAGIDEVFAQILPIQKAETISELQKKGKKVAMIGDGINDAPALVKSDLGIAIGSGTDVAIESADIVLVKNDINDTLVALDLSKYTMNKIRQGLFWAFIYNVIGIPVAMGALYPFTGFLLNPIIAGTAMAFSSVSVVTNALLMKRYKYRS